MSHPKASTAHSHHESGPHDHHGHAHDHGPPTGPLGTIALAFALNLAFTIIEVGGSYLSGSLAVLADAVHDFGDTISLGLALYLHRIATQARDAEYSYGYRRFSLLSAVLSGVFIIAGSLFVLAQSAGRIFDPGAPKATWMMGLALLGIAVNGYAALRLHRGHSHSEGMLKWHMLEDALGWAAVLVGAVLIWAFGWNWIDPLLAAALALFVVIHVARHLRRTVELFMQRKPPGIDSLEVTRQILAVPGVADLHDLHMWSLDGEHNVMSLHIVLTSVQVNSTEVKENIQKIMGRFGSFHTTIETEIVGDPCSESCG